MWSRAVWYGGLIGWPDFRGAHGRLVGSGPSHNNEPWSPPVRASTLLNRVVKLEGATVAEVHRGSVDGDGPVVVRLRQRRSHNLHLCGIGLLVKGAFLGSV